MGHEDFLKQAAEAKTRIKQVSSDEAEKIGDGPNALILDSMSEKQQNINKRTC